MSSPWNFGRGDLVWGVNDVCGHDTCQAGGAPPANHDGGQFIWSPFSVQYKGLVQKSEEEVGARQTRI